MKQIYLVSMITLASLGYAFAGSSNQRSILEELDQLRNEVDQLSKLTVVSGAVVAFNAATCPKEGWQEFVPAKGRFIRGIDNTDKKIDPEGKRNPTETQSDATKLPDNIQVSNDDGHIHPISEIRRAFVAGNQRSSGEEWSTSGMYNGHIPSTNKSGAHIHKISGGATETRPKNVALLYCEKI